MTSKATQFKAHLLHPRHWLLWLAFGLWRLITLLPYSLLLRLGKAIGVLVHSFPSR
ncbi:MAG: lipid A biosynthesis lauroyl acyltransferase, partial [Porticoccaceae bacterium]